MKTTLLVSLILILSNGIVRAQLNQEWVRSYNGPMNGNDEALTHTTDNAGNVYAAGKILGMATGFDIYVVKHNPSGSILWEKIYSGPGNGNDIAYSVAPDNSGNVFVTGESKGENTGVDYVLIKYNSQGDEQWIRRYNGSSNSSEIPAKVAADNSGNAIVTGNSWEKGSLSDIVTIKYNSDGVEQWIKRFNGAENGNEFADDLKIDALGNVYVAGSTFTASTINDFVIIKYSSSGDEQWFKTYNGTLNSNDFPTFLTLDIYGNAIQTGSSVGSGTSLDFATVKYSPNGEVVWLKRYTSPTINLEEPKSITSDNSGNIIITGTTTGYSSSYDYMTVKYSPAGDLLWEKNYNGPSSFNFDEARSVAADNNGNVYVTGLSAGTGTMDDIAIVKYDSNGNQLWVNRYNSPASRNDAANNISLDAFGNIIISGFITGAATGSDFAVIKFSLLTSLKTISNEIPKEYSLRQNYPNPFNPSTSIGFNLPNNTSVSLNIYDMSGRHVMILIYNEFKSAGSYTFQFNASDLSSGTYFYSLKTDDYSDVKKMVLIK